MSDGAPKLLSGNLYFSPFLTVAPVIVPEPLFPSKITLYSMSFQVAVKVTSPEMSISSPVFFNSVLSPTFQPANSLPLFGVNVGFGSSYLLPFATVCSFISPLAPASVWNFTVNSIGFHDAFITVSPVIVISVPGAVVVVASPTNHPANSLFSGGVKVSPLGKVYFSPDFLVSTLSSPVPPFG